MFIQKSKPKQHRPQHYHGHTIIELRNARTGIRDRVEHDNEFTLGIDKNLLPCGEYVNFPFNNDTWRGQPIYRNLIGGIFLFDKAINDVDGELPTIMPAGTKMIANGSFGVTNNANPTELGSYNSNESSFTSSGLTFVYDWTTSQGNGTIECVSLTSDIGGYIGYGNSTSNADPSSFWGIGANQNLGASVPLGFFKGNNLYQVGTKRVESFDYTITRKNVSSVSLFPYSTTKTVSIPSELGITNVNTYSIVPTSDGNYAVANLIIPSGSALKWAIYNTASETWSQIYTFTATTSLNFMNERCYIDEDRETLYISTGASYSDSVYKVGYDGTFVSSNVGLPIVEISDGLLLTRRTRGNSVTPVIKVYDTVNDTSYITNGIASESSYATPGFANENNQLLLNGDSSGHLYRNPLYLATINNLDNTVVKTTSDTMKVIYTVTPV